MADVVLADTIWVGELEVCRRLGVSRTTARKLAGMGRIGVIKMPGMERGRRYNLGDVSRLAEEGRAGAELADRYHSGRGFDLNGRVPDWVNETMIDRVDSSWMMLHAHGYISRAESEAIRRRILADVERSGRKGKFKCLTAPGERKE